MRVQLSADEPVACAEWDLARPAIPSRSRLYSLEPIGIGTPWTESLASYVSRLADAHTVRVRELVVHELLPFLGRSHLADARNANLAYSVLAPGEPRPKRHADARGQPGAGVGGAHRPVRFAVPDVADLDGSAPTRRASETHSRLVPNLLC